MGFTSNADAMARGWERRARVLEPYMAAATKEATRTLHAESKAQMRKLIYDKPIPTREQVASEHGVTTRNKKTAKKKAWHRTGNLQRSEKMRNPSAYLGIVENTAKYAKARHYKKKTRYPAPWRSNAIRKTHQSIRNIYRKAIRRAMTEGVISTIFD